MKRHAPITIPFAIIAGVTSCVVDGGGLSADGGVLSADGGIEGCSADYGATAAAQQLEVFVSAVGDFATRAAALDTTIRTECAAIATELGASTGDLQPVAGESTTTAACRVASQRLRDEFRAVRAGVRVSASVEVVPPQCSLDVSAFVNCVASCDARVQPGSLQVQCMGGELRGMCSGMCTGSCAVSASASCTGSCEGSCSGSCTGTCSGSCEGNCARRDGSGNCNGACMGTCTGSCSAGCTGSCSGQCVVAASASCMGECRGSCSVAFTSPRCTGSLMLPSVDVDCRASCETRARASLQCSRGQASLRIEGMVSADVEARVQRLRQTLAAHYGVILTTGQQLQALADAGVLILQTADRVPAAVITVGAGAVSCAAATVRAIRLAVPAVRVSVTATVSISGSIAIQ